MTRLAKNPAKMTDWPNEWEIENETHDAWADDERQPQGIQFTPKVAPSVAGRISWFAFEEAIDGWLDIATLTPERWAPSLKARLVGYASIYKPLVDREILRDPNE